MHKGIFDITVLEKAIKRLSEVLIRYQKDISDDAIRDSVIQRFEFTYSIALKTLSKYIEQQAFSVDEVRQMSFNDLIRTANQMNLLKSNLEKWTVYRNMRNITSHTYDEEVALKVVNIIPEFREEIIYFVDKLKNND